ncbi:MAG: response regulator [Paraprevotella sp.]|nr:response regulator [Paraprevotella sp.]
MCLTSAYAQDSQGYSFLHINGENGLSQSNVKAIIQDSYGFMWFGTKNGLNRYDGQQVVSFNCKDEAKHQSNHNISTLFEDDRNILWIGTDEGVYQYDPAADVFTFLDAKTDKGMVITTWISGIAKDKKGNIWICAPSQGMFRSDGKKLYTYDFPDRTNPHNICICHNGDIYAIAWYTGLLKYDEKAQKFKQITQDAHGNSLLNLEINTLSEQGDNLIMSIQNGNLKKYNFIKNELQEIDLQSLQHTFTRFATVYGDNIYAGTYDGLYILNEKKHSVTHFKQDLLNPSGLSDNIIYSVYRDREGGLWVGTMYGGVSYLPNNTFTFRKFLPGNSDHSLSSQRIRELAEDDKGNLWIGTEDAGLNVMSLKDHQIWRYPLPQANFNTHITIVVGAYGGKVYCSLYKEGLVVIDKNGKSSFYKYNEMNVGSVGCIIYALYMDRNGTLWVGSDFGVYYATKESMQFRALPELKDQWVFDILQDRNGTYWFATMGKGLWKYTPEKKSFEHYTHKDGNTKSVSSNSISSIMQDSKGNLWLSTDRGGICRYNPKSDDFTRFSVEVGMPDDVAYKILEDDYGYLWFGTNRGLVRFHPENKEIRVFTVNDGLCGNQFNYKSAVKGSDGRFYFGSIDGLVSFNPNIKEQTTAKPPIYITRFSIFNEEVTVRTPDSPLKQNIINTDKIVLPYNKANVSFDIALLSYSTSQTNEYFYRLEPIDKQWIRTCTESSISYANLSPGKYILHIRATADGSKSDNVQYATRSLTLIILPPWWASTWAYVIYVILIACAFAGWFFWYRKHKNKQFAEQQKLFEIEKEKELNQNKVEFFTEIAHEIRTPLTLINGPLEIIQEMDLKDKKLSKNLSVIAENTKRLLNLASQLLDFQKAGANKLTLNYENVDVSELLEETVNRFEPTFMHNGKELKIDQFEPGIMARIDKEATTKILSNLLNNALKYGKQKNSVSLNKHHRHFFVSVTSDGDNIPAEKAEQIFEPFFQEVKQEEKKQGVGIGLSLARSLALLHKGTLYLDCQQPGNTFVLSIPLNMDAEPTTEEESIEQTELLVNGNSAEEEYTKGYTLLIVEDEESLMAFMKERLSSLFLVETASNGKEALELLKNERIDLVISDVMMPQMNGYELCTAIKSDLNLCHIPLIFLTAKNDIDSKIKGLQVGAEAYIEKPFSFDYLKAQILSLLNNRQKERETFSKRPFFPVQNMQMSKEDEEFMDHVIEVINANMKDETFNVERMAEALCLSRSSLLRKIKTLFNLSPIDFIRLIRLKKSAELIQTGKYRVGEICFIVGFGSHSYFSKLFYKQFGMTPKDFEQQVQSTRSKVRQTHEINIEDLIQGNKANS